jgi:hypothetical protein
MVRRGFHGWRAVIFEWGNYQIRKDVPYLIPKLKRIQKLEASFRKAGALKDECVKP